MWSVTAQYTIPDVPSAADPFVEQVDRRLLLLLPDGADASCGANEKKRGFSHQSANTDGMTILLALSGGPDSTALLAALCSLGSRRCLRITACHVNHGLRGADSDGDEQFCRELCRQWNVPCHVERLSGAQRSEAAMRDARYAALAAHADRLDASVVITAHTLDDQIETVLFRLFRGSSPSGLVSIPAVRSLHGQAKLIRPLLQVPRQDLTDFLSRIGLSARQDSSNSSTEPGRNYLRHLVLPPARQRFPGLTVSIERLRTLLEDDERLLQELAVRAAAAIELDEETWSAAALLEQPISISRRFVADRLRMHNVEVSFERTKAVLDLAQSAKEASAGALTLSEYWMLRADGGRLLWQFKGDDESADSQVGRRLVSGLVLSVPGLNVCPDLSVAVQVDAWEPTNAGGCEMGFPEAQSHQALVDLSRCVPPFTVRFRQAGDTIKPFGMQQSVRMKKYLHTHQSAAPINRLRCLLIADAEEVIWVPGVGISEKVRVGLRPTHRLNFVPLED